MLFGKNNMGDREIDAQSLMNILHKEHTDYYGRISCISSFEIYNSVGLGSPDWDIEPTHDIPIRELGEHLNKIKLTRKKDWCEDRSYVYS